MTYRDDVRLTSPGLHTAAGQGTAELWEALVAGKHTSRPSDVLRGPWPGTGEAFLVDDLDAAALGVHRRVYRTSEKQARAALYGAKLALGKHGGREAAGSARWGLFLGLPTVDEELLPLPALEELRAARGTPGAVGELFVRKVPPFSGLSHLNSTAAAHISATFQLTGPMAAYSPFSDAGLQALIDGVLSVAEGESDAALIGAVSPKVHPLLLPQYESLGWDGTAPGEGSAFLVAAPAAPGTGARLAGFARGFGATADDRAEAVAAAVRTALEAAGTGPDGIGWVLPDTTWTAAGERAQRAALDEVFGHLPRRPAAVSAEAATGVLGPAQPLVHTLLALRGLARGRLLAADGAGIREEPLTVPRALVLACGVRGQVCAVVLEGAGA